VSERGIRGGRLPKTTLPVISDLKNRGKKKRKPANTQLVQLLVGNVISTIKPGIRQPGKEGKRLHAKGGKKRTRKLSPTKNRGKKRIRVVMNLTVERGSKGKKPWRK